MSLANLYKIHKQEEEGYRIRQKIYLQSIILDIAHTIRILLNFFSCLSVSLYLGFCLRYSTTISGEPAFFSAPSVVKTSHESNACSLF